MNPFDCRSAQSETFISSENPKIDCCREAVPAHRMIGHGHEIRQYLLHSGIGAVKVNLHFRIVHGREIGQSQQMIVVKMGEEDMVFIHGFTVAPDSFFHLPYTGARVEEYNGSL